MPQADLLSATQARSGLLDEPDPLRLFERRDRVALAVEAIRDSALDVWFEPDVLSARMVAAACPSCRVFALFTPWWNTQTGDDAR